MNRQILRIALPSIVTNVTVPLLSLVDTTIVGHLGAAAYIGAIALGGMIFNMAYWLCGFLRMGTGGLTAQAYGAGDECEMQCVLFRSLAVALSISLLLMVWQKPIVALVFHFIPATPEVERLSRVYYHILIWGAPAVLGTYSLTGWFLGMQNAKIPMATAIVQNVVNILVSLTLVVAMGWKVEGVATGTLVAQYAGFFMSLALWWWRYRPRKTTGVFRAVFTKDAFARFFSVNRDIFLRTLCLISVTTYFTGNGSAQGELVLAGNALLMQFYFIVSYVMDGFAYAGEALGGRFFGAREKESFERLTRSLFTWGFALGSALTLIYLFCGRLFLSLLTDDAQTLAVATRYLPFVIAVPLVSLSAFLFDGLFIGATSTRLMLLSMAAATVAFFVITNVFPSSNTTLWSAFLAYLGGRGIVQGMVYGKLIDKFTISKEKNT